MASRRDLLTKLTTKPRIMDITLTLKHKFQRKSVYCFSTISRSPPFLGFCRCPFVRAIRAGHRVHSHPVAFTQDMQLYISIPEIPDFCVYATGLNTSGLKLYIAYVPDLPTQMYELSVGDFEQYPNIFNSPPSASPGYVIHGHRIDLPQEQAAMENIPIEVDGGELKEGTVRCCLCDQVLPHVALGNHLRWNHNSYIGDKRTCPICDEDTGPHNYSRHFITLPGFAV